MKLDINGALKLVWDKIKELKDAVFSAISGLETQVSANTEAINNLDLSFDLSDFENYILENPIEIV